TGLVSESLPSSPEKFSKDELSFVEEVPKQIEIECPVCLNILTDPQQVSCCGHNFCKSCIERVKSSNGSCPMCNVGHSKYQSFADKNLSRIVNGLQVYCTNKVKGCQWKGDLKYLPTHLNKGKREGECQYEEVKCRYEECQTRGQRQHLNVHEEEWCDQRPYSCEHCYEEAMARFLKEDLLFVEELKVPAQIEIECPVCLHILTDPHQVSCCGRTLCKSCIERARASNGSCPMCKEGMEERFRYSVDKDCLHFVNFSLQVYCTNKPKGCEWKGNLRDLSTHLSKGKREGDCLFEEVKCRYECQTKDQRQKLVIHEKDDCNERPYKCEHCALEDRYIFITGDHLNTCPKYPTTCRNNCAQKIPRESISDHLTQCPLERM
ncbi:PREDICTED: TNF receptor-associated factor 5-like, partial [Amphimedon queenslandica]|uniref:RING-type domain-containing protein n=1 Tax=Amphimedon queenslandica TaxID=400682 RepID=A0AAN0IRV0_AMPQE